MHGFQTAFEQAATAMSRMGVALGNIDSFDALDMLYDTAQKRAHAQMVAGLTYPWGHERLVYPTLGGADEAYEECQEPRAEAPGLVE